MIRPSALKAEGYGRFVMLKMGQCQDIMGGGFITLHQFNVCVILMAIY